MIRYVCALLVVVVLCFALLPATSAFAANESVQTLTLDGTLYQKNTTNPLLDANVTLKIQILSSDKKCVLYEEQQTAISTIANKGRFNVQVGSATGAGKRTGSDPGNTMAKVFQNLSAISGFAAPSQTCAGNSYTPSAGAARYLRVIVTPNGGTADTLSPDLAIDAAPTALVAESVQGLQRENLLLVNNDTSSHVLSQSNLENIFSATNYPLLTALLGGTSTQYMRTNPTATVNFNNQRLTGVATPGTTSDAVNKGYADGYVGGKVADTSGVGPATGDGKSLVWDQAQNKWVAGNVAIYGTAGGDLTGNYPSPTIANNAVATVKIANDAITSAKVKSTGIAVNRLVATDNTTGANLTYFTCALGEIIVWGATGWGCSTVSAQAPVKTVNSKTPDGAGNIALNIADITGAGTGATLDYGTAAGQLVALNGTAQLPIVDGSLLFNVNAAKLQSRAVSTSAPGGGQVLGYNSSSSQWEPTTFTASVSLPLLASPGTTPASAPSYSFAGSADTGLFSQSAGSVALATAGATRLTVDASGMVGIGTTSAIGPLQALSAGETSITNSGQPTIENYSFGAISAAGGKPWTSLHVQGSSAASVILWANSGNASAFKFASALRSTTDENDATFADISGFPNNLAAYSGGYLQFFTRPDAGANVPRMTIDSLGSVGVGTATPGAALEVYATGAQSALIVPRDGTASRPTTSVNGMIRYNTNTSRFEFFENNAWVNYGTGSGGGTSFPLLASPGTALPSAPSYSFTSDTDTGLLSQAAGSLALTTNGTARFSVDSAGRVGIGTSTPTALLHLVNTAPWPDSAIKISGTTGFNYITLDTTDGSDDQSLELVAAGGPGPSRGGYVSLFGNEISYGTSGGNVVIAGGDAGAGTGLDTLGAVRIQTNSTDRLIVRNDGNVGIGTVAPADRVHVYGNQNSPVQARVENQNAGNAVEANFVAATTAGHFLMGLYGTGTAGGSAYLWNKGDTDMLFANNDTEWMRITANGKVGIGTTTPNSVLEITATGTTSALIVPRDTMANRPAGNATNGMIRYNTNTNKFEFFENNAWVNYGTGSGGGASSLDGLTDGITTANNLFLGTDSGTGASGQWNTAVGQTALRNPSSYDENTAFGYEALSLVGGGFNTAMGASALASGGGAGTYNTAIGRNAMYHSFANYADTAVGAGALEWSNGTGNVAIGVNAGQGSGSLQGRADNVFIGYGAGKDTTSAERNTMIGFEAGKTSTSGDDNILIGHQATAPQGTTSHYLNIGDTILGDLLNDRVKIGNSDYLITSGAGLEIAGTGTGASSILVPRDSTANRPTGVNGMIRYNTSTSKFEFFENNAWVNYGTGSGGTSFPLLASPGTTPASAPSYSFNGDADTGLLSQIAGTLALATNGTARMTIDVAGNAGIGTWNPQQILHVNQALINTNAARFDINSTVTTPNSVSTLTLMNNDTTTAGSYSSLLFRHNNSAASGVSYAQIDGVATNITSGSETGALRFSTRTDTATFSEKMRIDSAGNVGIGTSSPATALDVNGQIRSGFLSHASLNTNWTSGNIQSTSAAAGTLTFSSSTMFDGATYILILTSTGTFTLSTAGDITTWRCLPACGSNQITATGHTILSIIKAGTTGYVSWSVGY